MIYLIVNSQLKHASRVTLRKQGHVHGLGYMYTFEFTQYNGYTHVFSLRASHIIEAHGNVYITNIGCLHIPRPTRYALDSYAGFTTGNYPPMNFDIGY